MKKMNRMRNLIALALAAVMLFAFTACGKGALDGTYAAEEFGTGMKYTFSGDTVKMTVTVAGMVAADLTGTYEIGDGTITFTFDEKQENAELYSGTFDFVADEEAGTITIGLLKYAKEG